jgi:glycolate oxidase FAD binding subunit
MKTLIERIKEAGEHQQHLHIGGAGSKQPYLENVLSLADYRGVVHYQPDELVITIKAGTSLTELTQILAENQQMLAFEPPDYGQSTLGGTYACGLTGSSQPFRGRLRDYILGVKIINGLGDVLSFGGELMKNVAGYDISRLLVGTRGQLAVIAEISLKVLPIIPQQTYVMNISEGDAIPLMNQWAASTLPLSACAYYQQQFFYRLSGQHPKQQQLATNNNIWTILNPFRPHLTTGQSLWRVSVPSTTAPLANTVAIDWCGHRRWLVSNQPPNCLDDMRGLSLWQAHGQKTPPIQPITHAQIRQGIKQVFDPQGVFY